MRTGIVAVPGHLVNRSGTLTFAHLIAGPGTGFLAALEDCRATPFVI